MGNCLHCTHWQISETNAKGRKVLSWWGRQKFGSCQIGNAWEYLPRGNQCEIGKFVEADEETKKRREMAFEKLDKTKE